MSDIVTLMPCPFCGSDDIDVIAASDEAEGCARCLDCFAEGPTEWGMDAIYTAWNKRVGKA